MKRRGVYYLGIFFAIFFLCLGIGIFCLLFIGGTDTITTDTGDLQNKHKNETVVWEFLVENSGFATVHHVKNFFIAFYFSTSNIYLINQRITPIGTETMPVLGLTSKIILYEFGTSILKNLGWAALYEIVEKFVVFLFQVLGNIYPENAPIIFASDWIGHGEVSYNSLLSDLPQAIFACTGVCVLIYFIRIRVPSEILIKKKSKLIIVLQFAWIGLSGLCSFSIVYKKETSIGIIPLGFYAYFFIELFFICILYLGDFYFVTETKYLNEAYTIFVFYLITQWAAAFGLYAPGFITSNVVYVIFILFVLSIWKRIKI